jgi:hypothetical protein
MGLKGLTSCTAIGSRLGLGAPLGGMRQGEGQSRDERVEGLDVGGA